MADVDPELITIVSLVHDIQHKRSIVTLVWDEPDKRIALPVPYGTTLNEIHQEAGKAARDFAAKFASVQIRDL